METLVLRIGDECRSGRSTFPSLDSFAGVPWACVTEATRGDVDDAVSAARRAFLPEAVAEFNASSTAERPPHVQPPFYAMEIKPAITFTHGGVRIDADRESAVCCGGPIPGLLAAGGDSGGVFDGGYGGGLAAAGVFRLRAANQLSRRWTASRGEPSRTTQRRREPMSSAFETTWRSAPTDHR